MAMEWVTYLPCDVAQDGNSSPTGLEANAGSSLRE